MVKTVDAAFETLIGWIKPTEVENSTAASHRASIDACLRSNFGMTSFFRAGSFGHGTSVSSWSDVDYFAVIPDSRLPSDSSVALRKVKEALEGRFSRTDVYVNSPAVAVKFGTTTSERHEITPAILYSSGPYFNVYKIPDRSGGWMLSCPDGHNGYTDVQNNKLNGKAKQLIRLVKLWNYHSDARIRSIYLELRTSEYLSDENVVVYPLDFKIMLNRLSGKSLAGMQDPLGLSGYIYPCSDAWKPEALSKLSTAITRAEKALDAARNGKVTEAFEWWTKLFFGYFPKYG